MVTATEMSARALRAANGEILDPYEVTNPGDYSAEELRQIDVARAAWLRMERLAEVISMAAEKKRERLTAAAAIPRPVFQSADPKPTHKERAV